MKPERFLLRVLFSAKKLTIPAALLSILHQVGEALVPVVAGAAIDQALSTGDGTRLLFWLVVLGVNFLLLSFSFRFAAQLMALATEVVQHRLRATLSRTVLHPSGSGGRQPDGAVVSSMTNDVARTASMALAVFPVGEFAGVVFIAVSLLLIHWPLGLAVLLGAPVTVWLMGLLSRRFARASRVYQNELAATVSRATDLVTGYRVIKGVRAESEATRRYRTASQGTLTSALHSMTALGRFMIGSGMMSGVFIAGVAALAGWFAVQGQMSVGGLIASVGLAMALLPPMQMLTGNAVPVWAAGVASSGRLLDLLTARDADTADAATTTTSTTGSTTDAAMDSMKAPNTELPEQPTLTLGLPGSERSESTEIVLAPGELLGVHADDRTAARLAEALLHPRHDATVRVSLEGLPAAQLEHGVFRERVLVAPHQGTLFSGSIAENLAVAEISPAADTDQPDLRRSALSAAGCDDFLDSVGGIHGQIGEMGSRLSGGQRQRLALARALAADAAVLVLHDPTTAVDSVTEASIATRLAALRQGRSTLVLTSSPALLAACDRVVTLESEVSAS